MSFYGFCRAALALGKRGIDLVFNLFFVVALAPLRWNWFSGDEENWFATKSMGWIGWAMHSLTLCWENTLENSSFEAKYDLEEVQKEPNFKWKIMPYFSDICNDY